MNENRLNFPEIQDAHLDHMLRLAFEQETALWTQELLEQGERDWTPERQARADRLLARMLAQIDREERAKRRGRQKARLRRIAPRILEAAACAVLVAGVAASFAIANVEVVRSAVMKMLVRIDWEQGEMRMSFVEDGEAFDVPADWPGEYFPSYLPEGFEATWKSYSGEDPCIEYTSESGLQVISYGEAGSNTTGVFGIEGAVLSEMEINGHTAVVVEAEHAESKDDYYVGITWDNGEKWFVVYTSGISKEETVEIARSVKKILKK